MAMQTQMPSLSAIVGGQLSAAAAEHRDKPIDTGFQRLPPGIKGGIAKLQSIGWYMMEKDDGFVPKGQCYCRAAAVVLYPKVFANIKIESLQTSKLIELCATPVRGNRQARSFKENFADFVSLLKLLSDSKMVCQETEQTDPTGKKADAFYHACMAQLNSPTNPPVYISFSTEEYTPKKTQARPDPKPTTIENWHGLADAGIVKMVLGGFDPGAGIAVAGGNGAAQPVTDRFSAPPVPAAPGAPVQRPLPVPPVQPAPTAPSSQPAPAPTPVDVEPATMEEIDELVAIAMSDPDGETEDGNAAGVRLQELAWVAGFSQEQTAGAANWAAVGEMAQHGVVPADDQINTQSSVQVGTKWKYARRDSKGAKIAGIPVQDVEVVTVDPAAGTCTLRYVKDGKDVVGLRSKTPTTVKFEWLEQ